MSTLAPTWTVLVALTLAIAAPPALAVEEAGFSAGVSVRPVSSPDSLGMPVYPGATVRREPGDDGAGALVSLWGGSLGAQLHAIKLRSADPVARVSRWYRDALRRSGPVQECSAAAPSGSSPPPPEAAPPGSCDGELPPPGGHVFKLASRGDIRLVSLEPDGGGTRIQLVRINYKGD